jgi:hypothetical protein
MSEYKESFFVNGDGDPIVVPNFWGTKYDPVMYPYGPEPTADLMPEDGEQD